MDIDSFNDGLLGFLNQATSPFHAVREMVARLDAAGFTALADGEDWTPQPGARDAWWPSRAMARFMDWERPLSARQA